MAPYSDDDTTPIPLLLSDALRKRSDDRSYEEDMLVLEHRLRTESFPSHSELLRRALSKRSADRDEDEDRLVAEHRRKTGFFLML